MKKELEFKNALWGVNIFIRGHPTHRRFVHANIVGHIFEHQRLR